MLNHLFNYFQQIPVETRLPARLTTAGPFGAEKSVLRTQTVGLHPRLLLGYPFGVMKRMIEIKAVEDFNRPEGPGCY